MSKLYAQSAKALGTTVELQLQAGSIGEAEAIFAAFWRTIGQFEARFSRFIKQSELSGLNESAGSAFRVSSEMRDVLMEAKTYAKLSNGLYNPFILPALLEAGYRKSLRPDIEQEEITYRSNLRLVSPEKLEIHGFMVKIPANSAIDLGGIGKGLLADKLSNFLVNKSIRYCASLGGDMILHSESEPWRIEVQSIRDPSKTVGSYMSSKSETGLASSAINRNSARGTQAHIIDPRSGGLVNGEIVMCSVSADSAVAADVFASCILIGGEKYARSLLKHNLISGALMQYNNGHCTTLGSGFIIKHENNND
jgi:thiamine biosynthesis lipoprotein